MGSQRARDCRGRSVVKHPTTRAALCGGEFIATSGGDARVDALDFEQLPTRHFLTVIACASDG